MLEVKHAISIIDDKLITCSRVKLQSLASRNRRQTAKSGEKMLDFCTKKNLKQQHYVWKPSQVVLWYYLLEKQHVTFDLFQLLTVYQNQQEYHPTVTKAKGVSSTFVSRLETVQTPSNLKFGHMVWKYRYMWYCSRFNITAPNVLHRNRSDTPADFQGSNEKSTIFSFQVLSLFLNYCCCWLFELRLTIRLIQNISSNIQNYKPCLIFS
jgi:hypothetical protein